MTDSARDQIYVIHMLECIQRIDRYTGCDKDHFFKTQMVQDAVIRVLQTMAESAQRLSEEIKRSQPEIDWRAISGFRNILVHDYLGGIDLELIWQVIEQELPRLQASLFTIQSRIPRESLKNQ
jgi:uncharacterized protein with HEPN domain